MRISTMKANNKICKIVKKSAIILFWLCIWELCSLFLNTEILFPAPLAVLKALYYMMGKEAFWISVFQSILRVIEGISFSIITGILLGIISGINKFVEELLEPLVVTIKATPVMSVIIVALVWFQSSGVAIFTSILMCFPIIYTNVLQGIKSVDRKFLEVAKVYKVKRIYILKYIYIPSIKSYIVSGVLMCLGLGWKVTVASEVLSTPKYSIGLNLLNAKSILDMEELFAWTIVVVILSLIFENMFKFYINRKSNK